jgi:hypothetical protein
LTGLTVRLASALREKQKRSRFHAKAEARRQVMSGVRPFWRRARARDTQRAMSQKIRIHRASLHRGNAAPLDWATSGRWLEPASLEMAE